MIFFKIFLMKNVIDKTINDRNAFVRITGKYLLDNES